MTSGGPRGGAGGGGHPRLVLDQTEARRAEKLFFVETAPPTPPYLRVWMTGSPLSQVLDPALVTIPCQVVGDETKLAARETSHRLVV